jgi:hypothetical protein
VGMELAVAAGWFTVAIFARGQARLDRAKKWLALVRKLTPEIAVQAREDVERKRVA